MNDDELRVAGLFDPGVDDPSRALLVRRCLEIGLTVEEIRDAGDDLIDRAVQRLFAVDEELLTATEIADRAGLALPQVEQILLAAGMTGAGIDEPSYGERDLAFISSVALGFEFMGEDAMLQMVRVAAAAVVRIGDAAMSAFLTGVGARASRDDSGVELLEANRAAIELLARFGDVLIHMLMRYMRQAYRPRSDVSLALALAEGVDARELSIGFADLVGSATVADRRSLADLNTALDVFERTATDVINGGGGRVVKFIGDEVMFRAGTPDIACAIAVDLANSVRADPELPPLRVGIATGVVLSREGDFYGPVVNLAARINKLAPLHGVVATLETVENMRSRSDFAIHRLGAIEIQGIAQPVELAGLSMPSP